MDFSYASHTIGNSDINKHNSKEWEQHNKEARENREAQFCKLDSFSRQSFRQIRLYSLYSVKKKNLTIKLLTKLILAALQELITLLFCRNGFKQQTQSTKYLLLPHSHQYHVIIIKLFMFTAKNPSHFVIFKLYFHLLNSTPFSHERAHKIPTTENKEQSQVTFNTNNSPHWALTFSFLDTRRQATFLVPLSSNSKSKRR